MGGGKRSDDDADGDEQPSKLIDRTGGKNEWPGDGMVAFSPFGLLNISASRSLSQQSSIRKDL